MGMNNQSQYTKDDDGDEDSDEYGHIWLESC